MISFWSLASNREGCIVYREICVFITKVTFEARIGPIAGLVSVAYSYSWVNGSRLAVRSERRFICRISRFIFLCYSAASKWSPSLEPPHAWGMLSSPLQKRQ